MSVLLIGLDEDLGPAIVQRLISEGDVVGVIEERAERGEVWKGLGAHVAIGSPLDFDLVERAAQHARSIVIVAAGLSDPGAALDPILTGARLSPGERARIIFVAAEDATYAREVLDSSEFEYIVMTGRGGGSRLRRRGERVPAARVAEAVSAADDLGSSTRFEVDLTKADDLRTLGLNS